MLSVRRFTHFYALFSFLSVGLLSGCYTAQKSAKPVKPRTINPVELQIRQDVVKYALTLQGSSYKYAGTNPRTGFDCSGFTSYVLKQFKVPVSSASSAQSVEGRSVELQAVQPGDLIIFGKNKRNIQHVAMVVERNRSGIIVVHSTTSRGVIRENISTSTYWNPLILFARDVISRS
jgi:cell wall-associated NlpC family hydrolase